LLFSLLANLTLEELRIGSILHILPIPAFPAVCARVDEARASVAGDCAIFLVVIVGEKVVYRDSDVFGDSLNGWLFAI
jgi:hypothetical protein